MGFYRKVYIFLFVMMVMLMIMVLMMVLMVIVLKVMAVMLMMMFLDHHECLPSPPKKKQGLGSGPIGYLFWSEIAILFMLMLWADLYCKLWFFPCSLFHSLCNSLFHSLCNSLFYSLCNSLCKSLFRWLEQWFSHSIVYVEIRLDIIALLSIL